MSSTDGQQAPSTPPGGKLARWLVIALLCAMLVAACVLGYLGWTSTDTSVPASGYVALVLGVVFSLIVGVGLMALVFYSSRKGYDEPAVLIPEPESDEEDGPGRS
jgi:TRAP-type C4-dicarboxylate transport system permease small subunit